MHVGSLKLNHTCSLYMCCRWLWLGTLVKAFGVEGANHRLGTAQSIVSGQVDGGFAQLGAGVCF